MSSPPPAGPRPPRALHPAGPHRPRPSRPAPGARSRRPGTVPAHRSHRSRVRRLRPATAAGALCAALLALSGCEKPTPLATVTVGEDSVHTAAACYHGGKRIPAPELAQCLRQRHFHGVGVDPDATVRFGVDPAIADEGWTILLNGRPITDPTPKTYRTIPGSVFFNPQFGARGGASTVSILEGSASRPIGLWSFTFKKQT
ncbi:DUF2771 domain-containing protein [Streptomyces sp. TS71-3]|uniref:DUF2771 domain-containing protein n=1 Tax=Streptomyces sp. TS71-3 TaxID=2733862 RepID=UPI001B1B95A3|nr:DUF2771 domain-containing protein [Streptomyces sp. TS71-3]GHJ39928.1 hypothetical protein Sm713_55370 [Streptomyces sp. TS71-3]